MIRVNLLAVDRRLAAEPQGWSTKQRVVAGAVTVAVLAGSVIAWRVLSLSRAATRLAGETMAARQEAARLSAIVDEVRQFETERADLERRVAIIDRLRQGQMGPAPLLDSISRALPNTAWLTDLHEVDGSSEVVLEGRGLTASALPDFIAGLETSGVFRQSVDVVSSQIEPSPAVPGGLTRFVIKATIQGVAAPQPPAAVKKQAGA